MALHYSFDIEESAEELSIRLGRKFTAKGVVKLAKSSKISISVAVHPLAECSLEKYTGPMSFMSGILYEFIDNPISTIGHEQCNTLFIPPAILIDDNSRNTVDSIVSARTGEDLAWINRLDINPNSNEYVCNIIRQDGFWIMSEPYILLSEISSYVESHRDQVDASSIISDKSAGDKIPDVTKKYIPKNIQQDAVIINAIKSAGFDPKKFPKNNPGVSGEKAKIRSIICRDRADLFVSIKVFDTTWERLRRNGDIKDD